MSRDQKQQIDEAAIKKELRRTRGRIKAAARTFGIPASTLNGRVARLGLREFAEGLRTGTGRGRPRDEDVTPRTAWAAWVEHGTINAAARNLRCHPDKFLARIREARGKSIDRHFGGDVRAFLRADRERREAIEARAARVSDD